MEKKYKILMVEDNPDYQKAAVNTLSKHGFEIDIVSTREDFYKKKDSKKYDFYLVDVYFPYKQKLEKIPDDEVYDFGKEFFINISDTLKKGGYSGRVELGFDIFGKFTIQGIMPLGLSIAEDLKKENKNYLIVTAINHHFDDWGLVDGYTKIKKLDIYLKDAYREDEKSYPDFWEEVAKIVEEKLKGKK